MGEAFIVSKEKIVIEDLSIAPVYEFTGDSEWIWEDDFNWRLKMTSSGTLTFSSLGSAHSIDVFCVGAGGGVKNSTGYGAGGGYTTTERGIEPKVEIPYTITVGTGAVGADGGFSEGFGVKAEGGKAPSGSAGGAGGSGGGGYNWYQSGTTWSAKGGSDGSDGDCTASESKRGKGQGTTTREFGEPSGDLYAGGGAACGTVGANATWTSQAGGAGGGGKSGSGGSGNSSGGPSNNGTNGTDGLGGGGGADSTKGGSGIVIIRNSRGDRNHYFYNQGDECTDLTGGWVARPMYYSSVYEARTPEVTKSDAYIMLVQPSGYIYSGVISTVNVVDLSNISTLHAEITIEISGTSGNRGFASFAAYSNESLDSQYLAEACTITDFIDSGSSLSTTLDIDVSSLSSGYVVVGVNNENSANETAVTVTKIWGE